MATIAPLLLLLIGLSGVIASADPITPAVMLFVGLLWLARCLSAFSLVLEEGTLTVRTLVRNVRIPLSEIVRVGSAPAETLLGQERRCLRIMFLDGRATTFPAISGPLTDETPESLEAAVLLIRNALPPRSE